MNTASKWSKGFTDHILKTHFYYGIMERSNKTYPHRYPPLITKTLFDQVQAIKASFKKKFAKLAGKPYIYRGLIRCATCGLAITPEKHKGFVYYHCTQYNGKHGAAWLREEAITEQLGNVFKSLQVPTDILEQITTTLSEVHLNKVEFQAKHFNELTQEQRTLTKMIDNVYLDKLKGSITESAYEKFYSSFRDQLTDVTIKLERLQEAEDNYYITSKHVLDLINRAYDLFISSEVEEKRQLIKLVLSNVMLDGENIVYEAHKPFDLLINCSERQVWCAW